MSHCPNAFPKLESAYRIALIGEAPGRDEVAQGEPFVGASGRFLAALLSRAGIQREACMLANVCQQQPERNEIASFEWFGDEIQTGLKALQVDIDTFKPNLIVALGGASLHWLRCGNVAPRKVKKQGRLVFKWPFSPTTWRGSLFQSQVGYKALGTLHPAYVLRDYTTAPLLQFDLRKAVQEGLSPKLTLPPRHFCLDPLLSLRALEQAKANRHTVAIDIEGGIDTMSCISFAVRPDEAFIVPIFNKDFSRPYDLPTECKMWRLLAEVLEDTTIPKILQNSLYDRFVLQYSYGIRVSGVVADTMLNHHELYCEIEKGLDVQASIYTREPYYKGDRKSQNDIEFFSYCCRDSAVTYEIANVHAKRLQGTSLEHSRFNHAMLHPMLYMENRGIRYDSEKAKARREEIRTKMFEEQALLNGLTSHFVKDKADIFANARQLAFKKAYITSYEDIVNHAKKADREAAERVLTLMHQPNPTLATLGELEDCIRVSLNTGSSKDMIAFLYTGLGLPMQFNVKRVSGEEDSRRPTTDYEALLTLAKHCIENEKKGILEILLHCINIRSYATRERMLGIRADKDGRIRCGYNVVGSETGRVTCYESPTGSGYNLQTIPKYDRDLFLADDDCWIFQCDLSGADGWTVAAYCASLGDRTMLDDYLFGLKPAKILTLALHGEKVDYTNREQLKEACRKVDPDAWDYFAMKRVQHGASYVEGPKRISTQIFTDSEGKFYLSESDCRKLRDLFFFKRYPGVPALHRWMDQRIRERPTIISASGHVRHFFGRKEDLLPKAMAHEPQYNTTYVNNRAVLKLWRDPENRLESQGTNSSPHVALRIEPLHVIHDAVLGQFKKSDTAWAVARIRGYFDNPITIAGQRITIPFEGAYGRSWGELTEGTI